MAPSLRAQKRSAKRLLKKAQKRRHEAKPGGDRREKLARRVRFYRNRIRKLTRRIRRKKDVADWGWHTPVLGETGERIVAEANDRGLVVTATTDGQHAALSYHYQGRAIDFGVDWNDLPPGGPRNAEIGLQNWLDHKYPSAREIFGPDQHYVKNGAVYNGMFPGHADHVHVAI